MQFLKIWICCNVIIFRKWQYSSGSWSTQRIIYHFRPSKEMYVLRTMLRATFTYTTSWTRIMSDILNTDAVNSCIAPDRSAKKNRQRWRTNKRVYSDYVLRKLSQTIDLFCDWPPYSRSYPWKLYGDDFDFSTMSAKLMSYLHLNNWLNDDIADLFFRSSCCHWHLECLVLSVSCCDCKHVQQKGRPDLQDLCTRLYQLQITWSVISNFTTRTARISN